MKESFFLLSGAEVYLSVPDQPSDRWVMGVHGSGRGARDYRDTPFYAKQRDMALESGCAFAAVSMGQAVWGKEEGLARLEALHERMTALGYAGRCALMASSAGGSQMFRFAQLNPEKTALLIGIFPVWDLEVMAFSSQSLAREWGLEGEALRSAVAQRNPARYADDLPDVPVVICHGLNDVCVPVRDHALKLACRVPISLHMTREGHSTQSFGLYDTPLLSDALSRYGRQ